MSEARTFVKLMEHLTSVESATQELAPNDDGQPTATEDRSPQAPQVTMGETLEEHLNREPPSKAGKKRRQSKAQDDCQVIEGLDEDRGKWPPKAHLRLMEKVEDDFINNLLEGGVIKKANLLRYAARLSTECGTNYTLNQVRWKVNGTKQKFNAWEDTWKISGGGVDPARGWIEYDNEGWNEYCLLNPRVGLARKWFGMLPNGQRILEICEKVFTKCGATGKGAKSPNDFFGKIKIEADVQCPGGEDSESDYVAEEEVQTAEQLKEAAGSNDVEGGTPKRSKSFADEAKGFLQVALSMLHAPASSPSTAPSYAPSSGPSTSGSGTATSGQQSPRQINPSKRAYDLLKQLNLKTDTAIAAFGALKKDQDMLQLFLDGDEQEQKSVVAYQMGVAVDSLWPNGCGQGL